MRKKLLFKTLFFMMMLMAAWNSSSAHTVDSYTGTCNSGPHYSVQPNVSYVNNNSNYAWQYKSGATWICIVNGNNTINGNTYNVSGATYTATMYPGPIVFTNPNNSLQGLEIRCLISDGANPCTMPSGNTWTSSVNHFIAVSGTACACNNVTTAGSIGNDETFCGTSFDPALIQNLALPSGGTGTLEYVWLQSYDGGSTNTVISGANASSFDPGVINQTTWYRRCARRSGCTDYVGESNWVKKEVTNCCSNVTSGGTIGSNETFCGLSFNPTNITNITLPSGGTGTLEYVWLVSTDAGVNYTVIAGANASSYDPGVISQTTWYRRCARRAGCASYVGESDWIKKEVCPLPIANAGVDKNLNCTTTTTTIGSTSIAGNTYSWSPSTGLSSTSIAQPTANPSVTTTYTVTITNACGCTSTDAVIVNVNNTLPGADAGIDKNLNCTTTSTTIGTTSIVGNSYSWSPSTGLSSTTIAQPTASPSVTTTYTVTVTGANGCTATDAVVVNVNTTLPTVDAGIDKNHDCNTTSSMIGTTAIVGNTYSWSPSTGLSSTTIAQPTANPSVTTTYTITVTGANGCTATDAVVVNVNTTLPTVDAGTDKNHDCNTTSSMIGTTAIVGNTYSWSPSTGLSSTTDAMPTASPSVTTTYTVTVTGANGCTATDAVTVNVTLNPPVANITGNLEVCNGSTTTLTATGNGSYTWSNNSNANSIIVGAGTYSVTVTDGICSSVSTVTVNTIQGTIGNYVWSDLNINGIQDELPSAGINNIPVELWTPGLDNQIGGVDDIMLQSTTTAIDGSGSPGYYNFIVCNSGNYYVKFPSTVDGNVLTSSNQAGGVDLNSDANPGGFSPIFTIDVNGTGIAKNNNTIDAGYIALKFIGNRVWFDNDRNGTQDLNEIGVAGITVSLFDDLDRQVSSTVTDAYGYYYFNNLSGGTYSIAFTLPSGYVFTTKDANPDNALDSDVNPTTGITSPFTYVAGTIDLSFDAGIYIPTPLTSEVGDKVWNDINNNGIQDLNETGVAGVTVTLYDVNNLPVANTITDADGLYNFANVNPGTYSVGFSLPIGYIFSTPTQGADTEKDSDPNTTSGITATFTVVAGQSRTDIDAGIHTQQNTSASIGNFVWNDVNNNGIQEPNEAGVAGVTVTLYDGTGTNVIATDITDILGNYTFNDLPAGTYLVGFNNLPNGFTFVTPGQGSNIAEDSDPDQITGRTSVINLLAGQVNTTIDAGIYNTSAPLSALGNYVWYDRDLDGLQDANENGVPGVTVSLYNNFDVLQAVTITDNNGFYIFNGLNAGTYYVNFSNLPVNYKLALSNEGTDDTIDSDPLITTNNTAMITLGVNEVNLTVDAGIVVNNGRNNKGAIGDKVWNDENQNGIQDIDELGVQGVTVTLYQSNGITVIATTTTNSLGEYIFTNLDPADYVVGFTSLPSGYTYTTNDLGGDDELDSDAISANGGKSSIIALELGEINLTVDAGIYLNTVLASIGDYVWNDINQNGLQDPSEPGISGVTVKLFDNLGNVVANTTTDGNGAYQFTGLTAGTYSVEFSNLPEGYSFTSKDVVGNTNDNKDSDVDPITGKTSSIVLTAGQNNTTIDAGIFTLKSSLGNYVWEDYNNDGIQDANEPGISGITVTLYDQANNPITMAITNSRGAYNFVNLEPGTYSVGFGNIPVSGSFSPSNAGTDDAVDSDPNPTTGRTAPVTLVAGEYNPTLDAGIHLPTGAGLGDYVWLDLNSNGVQDPNEPGVPGVTVTLYDVNMVALRTTITDQNGAYTFSNLVPGDFKVGFSTIPTYYQPNGKPYQSSFTLGNLGNDSTDSDVDAGTGITGTYTVVIGQYIPTVDAGIKLDFVLPALDLRAFAKMEANNLVNVSWKTEYETNTSHFEIERSLDAVEFVKVATKTASGTTIGTSNYAVNDDISTVQRKDVIYYRIKMVDQDGKFMYSNIVNVKTLETDGEIMVYPSPFTSYVNVLYQTDNSTTISIKITDINGNVVSSKSTDVTPGKNIISMDNLTALASGMYMIMITDTENGTNTFFKLTK